jgi:hypothetical protein
MWMIRQFNVLAEILKTELGLMRESIQEQVRAVHDTSQASNKTWEQIPTHLAELRVPEDEKTEGKTYRKKAHRQQVILTWGTWLAFIAAAVYAWIAGVQLKTFNRQLDEMRKATVASQQAAYAACVGAQIASASLRESERVEADSRNQAISSAAEAAITIRDEGPEMFVDRAVSAHVNKGDPLTATFTFRNVGKSAALDVGIKAEVQMLKAGIEPNFAYSKPPRNWQRAGMVYPNDPPVAFPFSAFDKDGSAHIISDSEWNDFKAGKIYVSSYGEVTYKDIFGKAHWTHFCSHADQGQRHDQFEKCAEYSKTDGIALQEISNPAASLTPAPPPCIAPTE